MIKVFQIQIHLPPQSGEVVSQVPRPKAWPTKGARALPGAPAYLPFHGGHSQSGSGGPLEVGLVFILELPLSRDLSLLICFLSLCICHPWTFHMKGLIGYTVFWV